MGAAMLQPEPGAARDYARNHAGETAYPDLVYSLWLDTFFPCRVIAASGADVLIETPLAAGRRLRVPRRLLYRREELEAALGLGGGDGAQ